MPRSISIRSPEAPVRCSIDLPRSKSIANRALMLAALAGDLSCVREQGDAEDTRILYRLLGERPRVMHCGAGGTTFRFLLAWACVQEGAAHILTGDARLLERPHDDLVDALRALGAHIERVAEGYLVKGRHLSGGSVTLDSPVSSQFISALLLIAPRMEEGLRLRWIGRRLSAPYVRMTVKCLEHFGAKVVEEGDTIRTHPSALRPMPMEVPPDWSAAAFWFAIAALMDDAEIMLPGLRVDGWQGDEAVARVLSPRVRAEPVPDGMLIRSRTGARDLSTVLDLVDTPDLFQPLAVTYAALGMPVEVAGLHNLGLKETDRLCAITEALERCGVPSSVDGGTWYCPGGMRIAVPPGAVFATHGDHRMAMGLALLSLVAGSITLDDADVVGKSYPGVWEDMRKAGFGVDVRPRL